MDIYFEISFDEKNTYITLHSKKLRNYDTQIQGGFWEEVLIEDPELIFRNISNNKIFRMKLLNGVIGENLKTPWTIKSNKLENGTYNLVFGGTIMRKEYDWQTVGKSAKSWIVKNVLKKELNINLDSNLEIKDNMTVDKKDFWEKDYWLGRWKI